MSEENQTLFNQKSRWIWLPNWDRTMDAVPFFSMFRKELEIIEIPEKLEINISADTRYKLYINNKLVHFGPMKGDRQVWFYDTVNIAPFLQIGKNVIAVRVLRYPTGNQDGNHSLITTDRPGLYIDCVNKEYENFGICTDESWKCAIDENTKLLIENPHMYFLYIYEHTKSSNKFANWDKAEFNPENWGQAVPYAYTKVSKASSPGNLNPRTIPSMNYIEKNFIDLVQVVQSASSKESWEKLLASTERITIDANKTEIVEVNAGELMTGFLNLSFIDGKESEVKIIYAESYAKNDVEQDSIIPLIVKEDRTDYMNGHLEGHEDFYHVGGYGTSDVPESYETFWFRTFRFIRFEITTKSEPLVISNINYHETGYPIEVKTWVETSDKSLSGIWDISERTLRRCMHETYMDCPYYEQLQYVMDTRSQMLFTYTTSNDDRLARQCLDDMQRSQYYDGTIEACYPNKTSNVIPGFSIYYILMVHDHMMYYGDDKLVKTHMDSINRVLNYFDNNLNDNGLVGKLGAPLFIEKDKYWSFIDWCPEWVMGVPNAYRSGSITMESLLYIMGLEYASELAKYVGKNELSNEYSERANAVRKAVRKYCIGKNNLIQDGPNVDEYSEHCQVFGALLDILDAETSRNNLREVVGNKEYAQCSVAMAFYRFRALEKANLYELTDKCWDLWREMLANNLTTCVENETDGRSDCHAWGSLALYELPSVTLGVRPTKPGYEEIEVKPVTGYLNSAKGEVLTPKGIIKVAWEKVNGEVKVDVETPDGVTVLQ